MIRAARRSLAVAGTALLASVGLAAPAGAAAHVVAPGGSIQDAIDSASPGDTIILLPGEYTENLDLSTDGITIIGAAATLRPPATPQPTGCDDPEAEEQAFNGICISGVLDFETGEVTDPVSDVKVIGLTVEDFPGSGILMLGGEDAQFIMNTATDNVEYGIAAFVSTGTKMIANRTTGSAEAGLYLGSSPDANAQVIGNDTSDNLLGVFVRDAQNVKMIGNRVHANCVGVLFLADSPGPAGGSKVTGNFVTDNTKLCPAGDDAPFDLGGTGVFLFGANDVTVRANIITGNTSALPFSGGVVIATGTGGTAPTGNRVNANIIVGNTPDIRGDGTGSDNVVKHNICGTAEPAELCP